MTRPLAGPSLGLIVLVAGCAGHAKNTSPPPTVGPDLNAGAEADLIEHHRHHHHGGALLLIAMSLDTLALPPDQEQRIERLQSALVAKLRPARVAEQDLMGLLANEIEASSIDRRQVDVAIARLAAASAAVADASADDLDKLHAALTPPERVALMQKLQAHWALWKRANAGEHDPVATIAGELDLTPAQMEAVRSDPGLAPSAGSLHEAEIEQRLEAFAKAFTSDSFDAKSLPGRADTNRHMAEWGSTRVARFCEAASPLLNEAQRHTLVKLMREHLAHDDDGGRQ